MKNGKSVILGFTLPWVLRGWRAEGAVPVEPAVSALRGVDTATGTVADVDHSAHVVKHHDKRAEEMQWRALWERAAVPVGR